MIFIKNTPFADPAPSIKTVKWALIDKNVDWILLQLRQPKKTCTTKYKSFDP